MLSTATQELVADSIGYLRIFNFPGFQGCSSFQRFQIDLDDAVRGLIGKGARAWILDLRSNSGGSISAAAYLNGTFGQDGLVATFFYRDGKRQPLETNTQSLIGKAPVVILTDGRSASASEIAASSMQDAGRAHILGTATGGFVAAMRPFPLAGGALGVTIARVRIGPTERFVDSSGVKPDTVLPLDLDLMLSEGRDNQIEAAIEYLRTRLR
jgi:carboxyl-terminal processing protease